MKYIHSLIFIAITLMPCVQASIASVDKKKVDSTFIQEKIPQVQKFVGVTKKHYEQLDSWTPDNFWGNIVSGMISIGSKFTRYGEIKPKESKKFLSRAFANEAKLREFINNLAQSQLNIDYINSIISQLTETQLKNRDLKAVADIMSKNRHPKIPKIDGTAANEIMQLKDSKTGNFIMSDEDFYTFAAANLFIVCYIDERLWQKEKPTRGRLRKTTAVAAA